MKYMNESIHQCIASARCGAEPNRDKEEKHTLHLYNYISISIYSKHCTVHIHTFVGAFGLKKKNSRKAESQQQKTAEIVLQQFLDSAHENIISLSLIWMQNLIKSNESIHFKLEMQFK